ITGSEDGEVGAVHPTQIAAAAFLGSDYVRRMITLGVISGTERQNVSGAEFDTESTPLAALNGDGNKTFGHEALQDESPGQPCTTRAISDIGDSKDEFAPTGPDLP